MGFLLDPGFPFFVEDIVVHPQREPFASESFFQMLFIKKGKIYLQPAAAVLLEGQLVFLPPGSEKSLAIASDVRVIRIVFEKSFIDDLSARFNVPETAVEFPFLVSSGAPVTYLLPKNYSDAVNVLLASIHVEYSQLRSPAARLMIRTQFVQILVHLGRFKNPRKTIEAKRDPIREIIDFIRENYSDDFQFQDMVEKSGWNASYFCKAFRSRTGMPLFEFINTIRIQKACVLLKKTDTNIIDIAYEVGYQNISYFNRYFRKMINMSPSEYRKHIQD